MEQGRKGEGTKWEKGDKTRSQEADSRGGTTRLTSHTRPATVSISQSRLKIGMQAAEAGNLGELEECFCILI